MAAPQPQRGDRNRNQGGMYCTEVRTLIEAGIELSPPAWQHIAQCKECQKLVRGGTPVDAVAPPVDEVAARLLGSEAGKEDKKPELAEKSADPPGPDTGVMAWVTRFLQAAAKGGSLGLYNPKKK